MRTQMRTIKQQLQELVINQRDFLELTPEIIKILEKWLAYKRQNYLEFYCRHSSWKSQPCDNCGSVASPYDVGGRYIIGGEPDSDGYIDKHPLLVCGNCLDKLNVLFDLEME